MSIHLPTLTTSTANNLEQSSLIGKNTQWSVLKASGPTIREYLQGQITQNMNTLSDHQAIYSALLSPQGKAVAVLYMIAGHHDELILLVPSTYAVSCVARLRQFALGHQLRIGVIDSMAICSIHGADNGNVLDKLNLPSPASDSLSCARQHDQDTFIIRMPQSHWIISSTSHIETIIQSQQGITADNMESLRILNGQPQFDIEWNERLHPLNANLIEYNGVDFEKGCYVGQEVTSRMFWRGGIKKKLYRVQIHGQPDTLPCAIQNPVSAINIGELTSAALNNHGDCFGIALLPIEVIESHASLALENKHKITILEACHA